MDFLGALEKLGDKKTVGDWYLVQPTQILCSLFFSIKDNCATRCNGFATASVGTQSEAFKLCILDFLPS